MFSVYKKYLAFGILTCSFVLLSKLTGGSVDVWILVALVVATGIPHGAIDHIIYMYQQRAEKNVSRSQLGYFFTSYLTLLALAALAWVFLPEAMFIFFIALSAYHFGQSQLHHINIKESCVLKQIAYFSWGCLLLGAMLLTHWPQQGELVASLFTWSVSPGSTYHLVVLFTTGAGTIIWLLLTGYFLVKKAISLPAVLAEIVVLALLLITFFHTSLYLSFALYFGIWHASRVLFTEYSFLAKASGVSWSKKAFLRAFIPFSLVSFAGLAMLWALSSWWSSAFAPFLLFLIFISALTLPHALFMHGMYAFLSSRKRISQSL